MPLQPELRCTSVAVIDQPTNVKSDLGEERVVRPAYVATFVDANPCDDALINQVHAVYSTAPFPLFEVDQVYVLELKKKTLLVSAPAPTPVSPISPTLVQQVVQPPTPGPVVQPVSPQPPSAPTPPTNP